MDGGEYMTEGGEVTAAGFLKNVLKFSVSSWINFIIGILSVVVATRIFTPDIYGELVMFGRSAEFLVGVFCLGLDDAMMRFFYDPPFGMDVKQLFAKCLLVVLMVCFFVGGISVAYLPATLATVFIGSHSAQFSILLLTKVVSAIVLTRFFITYWRMKNKISCFTVQNVLNNFFMHRFFIFASLFSPTLDMAIRFDSLGIFVFMVVCVSLYGRVVFPEHIHWSLAGFRPVMRFALFMWPSSMMESARIFLVCYFIVEQLGQQDLGLYASTFFIVTGFTVIQAGFQSYWKAFVYRYYRVEQRRIAQVHGFVLLFLIVMMAGILCGQHFIYLFIGEQFQASRAFFALVIVEAFLGLLKQTTNLGTLLNNRTEQDLAVFTCVMAIQIGLLLLLLPRIGVVGAAVATACASVADLAASTWRGQMYYCSIESLPKMCFGVMLVVVMAASNWFLVDAYLVECSVVFFAMGGACLVFQKEISYGVALLRGLRLHQDIGAR